MSTFPQESSPRLSWGILLIRILVGWVFLSEGIQKFLFPAALGAGRFAEIGIHWPQFSASFVGVVEIACGTFLLLGLFTSLASVLLLIDIAVAIATTKLPMLLKQGLWATLHEARTDFSMLFGPIAILMLVQSGDPPALPGRQSNFENSWSASPAVVFVLPKFMVQRVSCRCSCFCFSTVAIRPL
jgi:putative oxidoreductase